MRADTRRLAVNMMIAWPLIGFAIMGVATALRPFKWALSNWVWLITSWGLLSLQTPAIVWLAEKYPLSTRPRPRTLLVHLAGALVVAACQVTFPRAAANVAGGMPALDGIAARLHTGTIEMLAYAVIVGIVAVAQQRRRARRSALAKARLEAQLERATLDELRVGVEPDRVLAEVAAIEAHVERSPARAEEKLLELSRFLRVKLARIRSRSTAGASPRASAAAPGPPPVIAVVLAYAGTGGISSACRAVNSFAHGLTTQMPEAVTELLAMSFAGALAPLLVALHRRLAGDGVRWRRTAILAAACVAHASLSEGMVALGRPFGLGRPIAETFPTVLTLSATVLFVLRRMDLQQERARSRIASAELSQLVAAATLRSLRTQLAPHFLFNTLNSILQLVRRDPPAARAMLQRLERLLRTTVLHDRRQEVSLREDLEITENYVEIERVRFRDALDLSLRIDPPALDARVPSFLLQPLVENAIRHGALQSIGRCSITVRAARAGDALQIAIENDGSLVSPEAWQEGIGLSSVRLRLRHLYGQQQDVSAEIVSGRGVRVRISLPWRAAMTAPAV